METKPKRHIILMDINAYYKGDLNPESQAKIEKAIVKAIEELPIKLEDVGFSRFAWDEVEDEE
jgi:hypothetical protein